MDPLAVTDVFRFSHILVVAIGFGAAALADIHTITRIHRKVDDALLTTLHACHRLVWATLVLMWLTGAVMVFIRTGFDLANFTPKLFSKLITVGILTANAVLISNYAMPVLMANCGKSILMLPLTVKLRLAGLGAVSAASWLLAMAIGVSKVLAASGWLVFIAVLPGFYIFSTLLAGLVIFLIHVGVNVGVTIGVAMGQSHARKPEPMRPAETDEQPAKALALV
jgi:hypothetical protein